jgi:hypothetical protein
MEFRPVCMLRKSLAGGVESGEPWIWIPKPSESSIKKLGHQESSLDVPEQSLNAGVSSWKDRGRSNLGEQVHQI